MNNDPVFIFTNSFSVYWYGLITALSAALAIALACYIRYKQTKGFNDILICTAVSLPLAFLCSRAFYILCFDDTGHGLFDFSNGGFSLYGALIGVLIGVLASAAVIRVKPGELLDAAAPGLALAIAVGRWAGIYTGENLGAIVISPAMQKLPYAVYSPDEGVWRVSLFVYESLIAMAIMVLLLAAVKKDLFGRKLETVRGDVFLMFVILYCIPQGIFESLRSDPLYFFVSRFTGNSILVKLQTVRISLAMGGLFAAIALAWLILRRIKRRGIKLSTLWTIPVCALCYVGYFNMVLRIGSTNDTVNYIWMSASAAGLIAVGVVTFWQLTVSDKELADK